VAALVGLVFAASLGVCVCMRGVVVVHGRGWVMGAVLVRCVPVEMDLVSGFMGCAWMPQIAVAQGLAHGGKPLQRQRKG
jgi:hypothetical protein